MLLKKAFISRTPQYKHYLLTEPTSACAFHDDAIMCEYRCSPGGNSPPNLFKDGRASLHVAPTYWCWFSKQNFPRSIPTSPDCTNTCLFRSSAFPYFNFWHCTSLRY